jgi:hypothetical protein
VFGILADVFLGGKYVKGEEKTREKKIKRRKRKDKKENLH